MKRPAGSTLALVLALVGAMFFATPKEAQAAPTIVSAEIGAPVGGVTEVRWHFRHHHHRRHFGHFRGRHYGHYRHHRPHHHHGRPFRF